MTLSANDLFVKINVGNVFWSCILKNCIEVQQKK